MEESIVWLNFDQVWLGKSLICYKIKITKKSCHNGLTNLLSSRASLMDRSYISIKYDDNMVKYFVADALETQKKITTKINIFLKMGNVGFPKPNLIKIKEYNRFFRFSKNRLNNNLSKCLYIS